MTTDERSQQIAEGVRREAFGAQWTSYTDAEGTTTEIRSLGEGLERMRAEAELERLTPWQNLISAIRSEPEDEAPLVYVAGPMTGIEDFNFPAFNAAAERLRANGYEPINPADNDDGDPEIAANAGRPWEDYMRKDIADLIEADAIAVLPGWERSRGASLEVHIAQALGMPILDAETLLPFSETVLQEAQRLVHGDRGDAYGPPIDDFTRTGRMWAAILGIPDVPPEKVGLCMVALKISREVNKPKRDNRVDMAGYAETVDMVSEVAA